MADATPVREPVPPASPDPFVSLTPLFRQAMLGCSYRVRSCALYFQLSRKRTPIKTKGPAIAT